MNYIQRLIGHFKTISKHRILVRHMCFKAGLYKQGLLHDLSKYSYKEFHNGVKYYQGYRSPIVKEKELNNGKSIAWEHHINKNKHHWEHWNNEYNTEMDKIYDLPFNYLLESCIDRISACKVYQKDKYTDASAYEFHINSKESHLMNENNRRRITILLKYVKDNGEEKALKYFKTLYLEYKKDNNFNI